KGSSITANSWSGIYVFLNGNNEIIGNTCNGNNTINSNTNGGIVLDSSNNRIEDNHLTGNGYAGIVVISGAGKTNNIIIKNSVSGNGVNDYAPGAGPTVL